MWGKYGKEFLKTGTGGLAQKIGWPVVIGATAYDLGNRVFGNQVPEQIRATNIDRILADQARKIDQLIALETARQAARNIEDAYARGVAAAGGMKPPAPPAPISTSITLGTAAPSEKTKLGIAWGKAIASPLFMPIFGVVLAKLSAAGGSRRAAPSDFPSFEPELPPLTGFEPEGVTYLGGELGGTYAPEFGLGVEPQAELATGKCERVSPKREPGQCRQGWFSETPSQLLLKEWSRRPCQ